MMNLSNSFISASPSPRLPGGNEENTVKNTERRFEYSNDESTEGSERRVSMSGKSDRIAKRVNGEVCGEDRGGSVSGVAGERRSAGEVCFDDGPSLWDQSRAIWNTWAFFIKNVGYSDLVDVKAEMRCCRQPPATSCPWGCSPRPECNRGRRKESSSRDN